jgi:hypothetical protein
MIHHVFANRSNIGDWLSARGIQRLLQPDAVVEHLCDAPFVGDTLNCLRRAAPNDLIVIGGGGLFMDYFVPFWEGLAGIADTVPLVIWGVGYCDMKRADSRPPLPLIARIIARARVCSVRDELTRSHLCHCQLAPPVACPTLNAVPALPLAGRGLLHVDAYDNVGPGVYRRMVRVLKSFAAETGRTYRQTNNLVAAGDESGLQSLLDRYAGADLVVSSRLHGCIIGLAMGRRVLAVSGDHKVESFMEAAGLRPWVLDLTEMDRLADRLGTLHEQALPLGFIAQARQANELLAERVKALTQGQGSH